jgi:hypothetical protein
MPVIIPYHREDTWLGMAETDVGSLKELLVLYPSEEMAMKYLA